MVVVLGSHRLPPSPPLSPACETEPVCRLITTAPALATPHTPPRVRCGRGRNGEADRLAQLTSKRSPVAAWFLVPFGVGCSSGLLFRGLV